MLPRPVGSLAAALSLTLAVPAIAQQVTTSQNVSITVRGIFSGTWYAQDALFGTGNGQRAEFVTTELDDWVSAGDVRNMRLTLGISGPEVKRGWRANGTFELDFFGALAAGANFGDEQPQPRLRLAYVDLTNGRTTLRVGQDWSPTLGNIPQSTSHIGFPLGWGSGGFIGWRFMQVKLIQTLSAPRAATTTRLQIALMNGSWSDDPNPTAGEFNAGERTLLPQIEGRLDFSTARWSAYIVGHVDTKDSIPQTNDDLTSWDVEGGFSTTRGDLTLHGNAHVGRGMGHQFAQIVQFGDIQGWGAWGQVGYNLTPRWSIWGLYGTENPDDADVVATAGATQVRSWLFVPMLRWRSGAYSAGAEWLHSEIQLASGANLAGNQVLLSVRYDF